TTLEPALGVVDVGYERFVVADIPGLIEGAHEGAGLGLDFLRHVERTKVLVHMVDGSSADPLADVDAVNRELSQYSEALADRPQLLVVNKIDLPEVEERMPELKGVFSERGITPLFLSAAERRGTDELVRRLVEQLAAQEEERPPEEIPTIRPQPLGRRFNVRREGEGFRVEGERVATFAEMMPVGVEEGKQELWWRLGRWGVSGALRRAGAQAGYQMTEDYNGEKQEGFGPMEQTVWNGRRWSAANAYLRPAQKTGNVTLIRALAQRVVIEEGRAVGVEVKRGNAIEIIRAQREVVLAASSINSPKLLMLSGIGPAAHLAEHGIDVVADRPGVGQNLQDHLELYIQMASSQPITLYKHWNLLSKAVIGAQWLFTKTGMGASNQFESAAFIRSKPGVEHPDIQYH
ncbi:hypothetical protein LCGC14_2819220, partial [marine sediment metagenome]